MPRHPKTQRTRFDTFGLHTRIFHVLQLSIIHLQRRKGSEENLLEAIEKYFSLETVKDIVEAMVSDASVVLYFQISGHGCDAMLNLILESRALCSSIVLFAKIMTFKFVINYL
ncbi:hypothetical protein OsJ_01903 [Oryza sativa Japonica Group]|uniref:Uncharacterized protein n=1 Tax=Oryza sativa subsp. japonica TaxID=39947 RepID=B9EX24_ORYSJ|nr:hypothetical protein OsJ_01903 [Oryza sativa Japonica Group]